MNQVRSNIHSLFPHFFHLNQQIDLALLNNEQAQNFLNKIQIELDGDFFSDSEQNIDCDHEEEADSDVQDDPNMNSQRKSNCASKRHSKLIQSTVSTLMNYLSCSNGDYRAWCGLALLRLCLGLHIKSNKYSFQDSINTHKGKPYGIEALKQGGLFQFKQRIIFVNEKLGEIGKKCDQMSQIQQQQEVNQQAVDGLAAFNTYQSLKYELELRVFLNLSYLLIYYNVSSDKDAYDLRDFISQRYVAFEEFCYSCVTMSLEVPVMPIKKILLLFVSYLHLILGSNQESQKEVFDGLEQNNQEIKFQKSQQKKAQDKENKNSNFKVQNLLYTKLLADYYSKTKPRWFIQQPSLTQKFYCRQMNKQNPIPQIIVVCTLRVLLITCPNTKRQSTGVDIIRQWQSSLFLLAMNQFKNKNFEFQSTAFKHQNAFKQFMQQKSAHNKLSDIKQTKQNQRKQDLHQFQSQRKQKKSFRQPSKQSQQKKQFENDNKQLIQQYELDQLIQLDSQDLKKYQQHQNQLEQQQLKLDQQQVLRKVFHLSKQSYSEHEYQEQRHKLIVARTIGQLFTLLLSRFKHNCKQFFFDSHSIIGLMQYVYLNQLIVDANGVLVLLKFLNQDLSGFRQASKLPLLFTGFADSLSMNELQRLSIRFLLKLMRRTCERQSERIKSFLVQYKAATIMKKIIAKFNSSQEIKKLAAKVSKIQIKFMPKKWRQCEYQFLFDTFVSSEYEEYNNCLQISLIERIRRLAVMGIIMETIGINGCIIDI